MTTKRKPMPTVLVALLRTVALTVLAVAAAVLTARADDLLIPKGTVIPVALTKDISTATAKVGDTVKAVYTGEDDEGFPTGTVFIGYVTAASARSGKTNGSMKVSFRKVVLPGKPGVAIDGSPVTARGEAPKDPSAGKKKKGAGKGALAGAVGGMLIAGNDTAGALLGGLAGGAVGASASGKAQDLSFRKGTAFGIKLNQAARVPQPSPAKPKTSA